MEKTKQLEVIVKAFMSITKRPLEKNNGVIVSEVATEYTGGDGACYAGVNNTTIVIKSRSYKRII